MKKLKSPIIFTAATGLVLLVTSFSNCASVVTTPANNQQDGRTTNKQSAEQPKQAYKPEATDKKAEVFGVSAPQPLTAANQDQPSLVSADDVNKLRSILLKKGIYFGTALQPADIQNRAPRPANYMESISKYFNFYTISVTFKTTENQQGVFTFNAQDKMVEFALAHHAKLKAHVLAWGDALPDWVTNGGFTPEQLKAILKNHVQTIVKHFKDKYPGAISEWNVVNEPICNDAAFNKQSDCYADGVKKFVWSDIHKPGSSDPTDYIQYAFEWTHEIDPSAKLFMNENNIETSNNPPKLMRLYNVVKTLKAKGTPIDGIGFESHIRSFEKDKFTTASLVRSMNMFADMGLETQISEFDCIIASGRTQTGMIAIDNPRDADYQSQAELYRIFMAACLHAKNCTGFTTWGVWDDASWTSTSFKGAFHAHLLDDNFKPKQSFKSMVSEAETFDKQKN